jgi:CubicO group peptidase (beta-lactamase class C family)
MVKKEFFLTALMIIIILVSPSCNDDPENIDISIGSKIDQIIENNINENIDPGLTILIYNEGEIEFRKAYGLADTHDGRKFLPETPCFIGSLSKQFTAMAVMICAERELLNVQDNILDFFPEYPDLWQEVTIHHLLTHQSGIPDYLNDLHYSFEGMTNKDALDFVIENGQMNFTPGERYSYSNTGYIILAELVERVSGKSLGVFCKNEIFSQLGMAGTCFVDENNQAPVDRAIGHTLDGDTFDYTHRTNGDGGMISTVDDMLRWDKGVNSDKLVSEETISKMITPFSDMNNGAYYSYGWMIDNFNGFDLLCHDGGLAGIFAYACHIKQKDFYLCLFGNSPDYSLFEEIIFTVLDHYVPENINAS